MRHHLLKSAIILGMGLFLFSRILNSSVLFYINERFVWLTFAASIGFVLVGVSFIRRMRSAIPPQHDDEHAHHQHDHGHEAHVHSHNLSAIGVLLLLVPILLGLLIPPRPLGSAAMANRELNSGVFSVAAPANSVTRFISISPREKNIIDWLVAFEYSPDLTEFSGQDATVTGFVYHPESLAATESFMVGRFAVSCCVADATPVGMMVRWPEANTLQPDQWVEITGKFELGDFRGKPAPILIAESVTEIEPPTQPYIYY